jgi:hypothetical protein
MKRKRYSSPGSAAMSIWAGRFVPVFFSEYISRGAFWE